jgi:hypothetical protein
MHAFISLPSVPIGKIKTFGDFGPKYEIGPVIRKLEDGDWLVEITLIETDEAAEYRLSRLFQDPEAH